MSSNQWAIFTDKNPNFLSIFMRHSVFDDRFSEYYEDNDMDVNVMLSNSTEHSETACCQSGDSSTKQITRSGNTGNMFRTGRKLVAGIPHPWTRLRGDWDQQRTGVMFPDCCRTFVKPYSLRHHPTGGGAFILTIEIPERIEMGKDRWRCTGNYGKGNTRWKQHSISPNGLV